MISAEHLTSIGRFGKPHGVKGELSAVVDAEVDFDADVPNIFVDMDGLMVPFFIASSRAKGSESVLLTLEGVDTQEKALPFVNKTIYVATDSIQQEYDEDDNDGVYLDDLIGYRLDDVDGSHIGTIESFDDSTENYLFGVRTVGGRSILIPAASDLMIDIDSDAKTITMNLPEGIIDL